MKSQLLKRRVNVEIEINQGDEASKWLFEALMSREQRHGLRVLSVGEKDLMTAELRAHLTDIRRTLELFGTADAIDRIDYALRCFDFIEAQTDMLNRKA